MYTQLLSDEVTNCLTPVCENLQKSLGDARAAANQKILFMMLQNGCAELLPDTPDTENTPEKWCNYLLYEMDDTGSTEEQKLEAANIFKDVNKSVGK